MNPQPIETAPKNGEAILTNCGIATFIKQVHWGSPVEENVWVICDIDSYPYKCVDEGWWIVEPKLWCELPEWMK